MESVASESSSPHLTYVRNWCVDLWNFTSQVHLVYPAIYWGGYASCCITGSNFDNATDVLRFNLLYFRPTGFLKHFMFYFRPTGFSKCICFMFALLASQNTFVLFSPYWLLNIYLYYVRPTGFLKYIYFISALLAS